MHRTAIPSVAATLAVAPLPGASVRPDPAEPPIHDATLAVSWALRHFDELTLEQQAAVGEALSPAEAVGRSGFRSAAPKIGCYGQVVAGADSPDAGPYRQLADGLIGEIERRLGGTITLVASTYILLDHRDLGLGTAYTWADPGDCDENAMATCTIHLSAKAEASDPTTLRGILAHELMHCFQFQYLGVAAYEMPDWILEGAPAWVGEDIAGGTPISTPWWTKYLTTPERSLYSRSYDAIGFYAHLDEIGIDPWTRFTAIYDGFSFEPAWEAAGASSGSFLESWPSSTLRRTDIGRAWDATGPGITIDRATPKPLAVREGSPATASVGKVSGGLYRLAIDAELVTIEFSGSARLGAPGGVDRVLESGTTFCAKPGGCTCPSGAGSELPKIPADAFLGLTGGTQPGRLTITGAPLTCGEQQPDAVDPCLVGRWESTVAFIEDAISGAPSYEQGGGAGIVLVVERDGSFTMDFDESTPQKAFVAGAMVAAETRGVAHGTMTARGGKVKLHRADYDSSLTTTFSFGRNVLPGGIGIESGTYSCGGSTLETRSPFELGETVFVFERS